MTAPLTLQRANEQARLSDAVYETLLEAILSGILHAGDPVSEVELARQLQVSRTPVHDAIVELAKDGLVVQRLNRRPVIAHFYREDIHDIYDMRILLEGEAISRAVSRLDRTTLAEIRTSAELLASTQDAPDWIARWTDHDEQFHSIIAQASGSKRLCADIARYRLLHRSINKLRTNVACLGRALDEHLQILQALDARDASAARAAMIEHLTEWQAYFVNHLTS